MGEKVITGSRELEVVVDASIELPTDEIQERIRSEWQSMRKQASGSKGWRVEDVVIDLVCLHRREVASAPYQTLVLELGRFVLELAQIRSELTKARIENDELKVQIKTMRNGRLSN